MLVELEEIVFTITRQGRLNNLNVVRGPHPNIERTKTTTHTKTRTKKKVLEKGKERNINI